jgi:hypothetical protein
MHSYQISILGLTVDVICAFLLSVEAIKLHNVKFLCDRVLRQIYHQARSPSIIYEGETVPRDIVVNWASRHTRMFTMLHYVAGTLLLISVDLVSGGRLRMLAISAVAYVIILSWYWVILIALFAVPYLLFGVIWGLGEIVHIGIVLLLKRMIAVLDFIQVRYADGTVGILGFGLLFIGFILQALGTYWGRSPSLLS